MALQFSKHFFVRLPLGVNPCVCTARNGVVVYTGEHNALLDELGLAIWLCLYRT